MDDDVKGDVLQHGDLFGDDFEAGLPYSTQDAEEAAAQDAMWVRTSTLAVTVAVERGRWLLSGGVERIEVCRYLDATFGMRVSALAVHQLVTASGGASEPAPAELADMIHE